MAFVALATLNSAGYRYGASDQAFYVPAVTLAIHPDFYPRDAAVIESQARLTIVDEMVGGLARTTGAPVPILFAILYVISLALLMAAGWRIGSTLYRSRWTTVALLAALTLRHAVMRSGTNTLEGYFHPRQLAFGLGALAVGAFLRGGLTLPAVLLLAAFVIHSTTALWFVLWLGAAFVAGDRRRLRVAVPLVAAGAALAAWMLVRGPLAGRLQVMDAAWLATLADKPYLFPLAWPLTVWLVNLAYVPLVILAWRWRRARGIAGRQETALVAGAVALPVVFLATLPFNAARVQFAVQLQPARVFWLLDFLAVIYVVWMLAEGGASRARRPQVVAAVVLAVATARGIYTGLFEFPGRPVASLDIRDDDWGRAMRWARTTPPSTALLADPMHAVMYGSSVRVAAERDVLVEASKDQAIGMYSRDIAMRTLERTAAVGDFPTLTPARARELAERYGLDYLVSEATLDLPVVFSSGSLRVYALRAPP